MIVYNVTVNIEESVHDNWLNYMRNQHIPEVMATGCFVDNKISRVVTRNEGETGITYAFQYRANTMNDYFNYRDNHAPLLQKDHTDKYGGKFVAFRTLLEELE